MIFQKRYKVATHNGEFHADDIFAVATLRILLNGKIKLIRTRDKHLIEKADYVVDVGGEYDSAKNRFDHHQEGKAGVRPNGISYAAFGLVWKTFGEQLCGSKTVAEMVEKKLVSPLDANDNGQDVCSPLFEGVYPYTIETCFSAFRPTWKEEGKDLDVIFSELLPFAEKILAREIEKAKAKDEATHFVDLAFQNSPDKRLIVLDAPYAWHEAVEKYPEALYVVQPKTEKDWRVYSVRKEKMGFTNKKDLPKAWAGKKDGELEQITGVSGARFCHNGLFMAATNSKESALKLAELAVKA